MFFQHLTLGDLVRCSQVCRRWYRAADDIALQARCCIQSYAPRDRQRLLQAMDGISARHALNPALLAPDNAGQQQAWTERLERGFSARVLFYGLMRQRLMCDSFTGRCGQSIALARHPQLEHDLSADGRHLALSNRQVFHRDNREVSLWHRGPAGFARIATCIHPGDLFAIRFSADSHRVHLVSEQGYTKTLQWQPDLDAGRWHSTSAGYLCSGRVYHMAFSQDAHYLAASVESEVLIFCDTAAGRWQHQASFPHPVAQTSEAHMPSLTQPGSLVFSAKARHLVMSTQHHLWACHRTGNHWRALAVEKGTLAGVDSRGYFYDPGPAAVALIDNRERRLAAAFWNDWTDRDAHHVRFTLSLWNLDSNAGWQLTHRRVCVAFAMRFHPFALAFDPDGRQLTFSESDGSENTVCLLPTAPADSGEKLVRLPLLCGRGSTFDRTLFTLKLSCTGLYLAASAWVGVQIWRRDRLLGWQPVHWLTSIRNRIPVSGQTQFSPDGHHCAVAAHAWNEVSVWGPGPGGRYCKKLSVTFEEKVNAMRFTPDGTQLMVYACSSSHDWLPLAEQCQWYFFSLAPAPDAQAEVSPVVLADSGRLMPPDHRP